MVQCSVRLYSAVRGFSFSLLLCVYLLRFYCKYFVIKIFSHLLTSAGSVFFNDLLNTIFVNRHGGPQLSVKHSVCL